MGWDLGHKVVHWLYAPIVQPTISFASFVWWPGCQMASTKNKLSKIQRLAFLGITGRFALLLLVLWRRSLASFCWIW